MTHPILSTEIEVTRTAIGTAVSEGLKSPQAMAYFYSNVAKSCYSATESKQISRLTAARFCGVALVPVPHHTPFIKACIASLKIFNKLERFKYFS
jgi:hypothetical protein